MANYLDYYSNDSTQKEEPDYLKHYGNTPRVSAPVAPVDTSTSLFDRAKDIGITGLKSAIGVPEAALGLADIATGGRAGKYAEEAGFRPREAKDILETYYSPAQQAANANVRQAEGFVPTLKAYAKNPSVLAHDVGEQAFPILAGGVMGAGVGALAPNLAKAAPYLPGAVGEAGLTAGQNAEQVRQQTENGLLDTEHQTLPIVASSLVTGGIGALGGKLANELGFTDVQRLASGMGSGATNTGLKGLARNVAGTTAIESLEEGFQSPQEQVAQNYALDRPLSEGVGSATAQGLLLGGAMGGGTALVDPANYQKAPAGPLTRAAAQAQPIVSDVINEAPEADASTVINEATKRTQEAANAGPTQNDIIPDQPGANADLQGLPGAGEQLEAGGSNGAADYPAATEPSPELKRQTVKQRIADALSQTDADNKPVIQGRARAVMEQDAKLLDSDKLDADTTGKLEKRIEKIKGRADKFGVVLADEPKGENEDASNSRNRPESRLADTTSPDVRPELSAESVLPGTADNIPDSFTDAGAATGISTGYGGDSEESIRKESAGELPAASPPLANNLNNLHTTGITNERINQEEITSAANADGKNTIPGKQKEALLTPESKEVNKLETKPALPADSLGAIPDKNAAIPEKAKQDNAIGDKSVSQEAPVNGSLSDAENADGETEKQPGLGAAIEAGRAIGEEATAQGQDISSAGSGVGALKETSPKHAHNRKYDWAMTRQEFVKNRLEWAESQLDSLTNNKQKRNWTSSDYTGNLVRSTQTVEGKQKEDAAYYKDFIEKLKQGDDEGLHKDIIKRAKSLNYYVPPEVLADYPDLQNVTQETPKTNPAAQQPAPYADKTKSGITPTVTPAQAEPVAAVVNPVTNPRALESEPTNDYIAKHKDTLSKISFQRDLGVSPEKALANAKAEYEKNPTQDSLGYWIAVHDKVNGAEPRSLKTKNGSDLQIKRSGLSESHESFQSKDGQWVQIRKRKDAFNSASGSIGAGLNRLAKNSLEPYYVDSYKEAQKINEAVLQGELHRTKIQQLSEKGIAFRKVQGANAVNQGDALAAVGKKDIPESIPEQDGDAEVLETKAVVPTVDTKRFALISQSAKSYVNKVAQGLTPTAAETKSYNNVKTNGKGDLPNLLAQYEKQQNSQQEARTPEETTQGKAPAAKDIDNKLREGEISVAEYQKETGLTDDEVDSILFSKYEGKTEYKEKINALKAAVEDAKSRLKKPTKGAGAEVNAYSKKQAAYSNAIDTLNIIEKNFEHPFNNNLISRLPEFLKIRYGKQWENIATGDKAKKEYYKASDKIKAEAIINFRKGKAAAAKASVTPQATEIKASDDVTETDFGDKAIGLKDFTDKKLNDSGYRESYEKSPELLAQFKASAKEEWKKTVESATERLPDHVIDEYVDNYGMAALQSRLRGIHEAAIKGWMPKDIREQKLPKQKPLTVEQRPTHERTWPQQLDEIKKSVSRKLSRKEISDEKNNWLSAISKAEYEKKPIPENVLKSRALFSDKKEVTSTPQDALKQKVAAQREKSTLKPFTAQVDSETKNLKLKTPDAISRVNNEVKQRYEAQIKQDVSEGKVFTKTQLNDIADNELEHLLDRDSLTELGYTKDMQDQLYAAKKEGEYSGSGRIEEPQVDLTDIEKANAKPKEKTKKVSGATADAYGAGWRNSALQRPKVINAKTGEIQTGITQVNSPEDALHVIAPIRKNAQEQMLAIVLDKDNNVLQIIKHTAGLTDSSMVDPGILAGSIHSVPGAESVYFAHNHPTGISEQSKPDIQITNKLGELLSNTGIKSKGMLVAVAGRGGSYLNPSEHFKSVDIKPTLAPRNKTLPITERFILRNTKIASEKVTSPDIGKRLIPQIAEDKTGIVLLDNQHQPVSFVQMSLPDMAKLRAGKGAGAALILQELHETNARALIININDKDFEDTQQAERARAINNVGNFAANTGNTRLLDAIYNDSSHANAGLSMGNGTVYYSQATPTTGSTRETLLSWANASDRKLIQQGRVIVAQSLKDVPNTAISIDAGGVEGFYKGDTIYLIADAIGSKAQFDQVKSHEYLHASIATNPKLKERLLGAQSELNVIFKQVESGQYTGRYKAIYDKAMQRVDKAKTTPEARFEEFLAYAVSEYNKPTANLPERLLKAIKDLVATIKAAIFRYTGQIANISPADLSALARSSLNYSKSSISSNIIILASKKGYEGTDMNEAEEWLRAKAKGLDLSQEARMERAEAMGYDIDTIYYNGGKNKISKINTKKEQGTFALFDGVFATTDRMAAESHGDILTEFVLKPEKVMEDIDQDDSSYEDQIEIIKDMYPDWMFDDDIDVDNAYDALYDVIANDKDAYRINDNNDDLILKITGKKDMGYASWELQNARLKFAKALGYDAVSMNDEHGISYAILPESTARTLDSAFDPDYADSPNLLASVKETKEYKKTIKKLVSENESTAPKIPTKNVFLNDAGSIPLDIKLNADEEFENNLDKFPTESVNIHNIVPTQKNITIGNLERTQNVDELPHLINYENKYYVADGHHRIANAILNGDSHIDAKVFNSQSGKETKEQQEYDATRAKYFGTKDWMKAPNGKPTKLNEAQWVQTRTPAFKEWFGDWLNDPEKASKVVDPDTKEPMVVYHGTDKSFNKINMRKGAQNLFWFTSDKAAIEKGDVGAQGQGKIIELFANIKNPANWKQYDNLLIAEFKGRNLDGAILPSDDSFDGFILNGNQVKSAIKNTGAFSPQSNDIRYSVAEDDAADPNIALNQRIREQHKTISDRAKQWLKREFSPGGLLPKQVFDLKISRDSEMNAEELVSHNLIANLDRAIKADFGKKFEDLTQEQKDLIDARLKGDAVDLPSAVKDSIDAMRLHVDRLSGRYAQTLFDEAKQLQEEGKDAAAAAKVQLLNTIAGNIGKYVNRSYRAFDDEKWALKVPDDVLNAARKYFVDRFTEKGAENPTSAAQRVMNDILKTGTAYDTFEQYIKESKLGAKDLSVLIKRKEIAPEVRALLGEYKDARINFAKSATKMSRLIFNDDFLKKVKSTGIVTEENPDGFLFNEDNRPSDEHTVKIAADSSSPMSPLNGLYTYPEINQAFSDALNRESMEDWYRMIVQANGLVKYGKTVLSPTTAVRNWMSAYFFTMANAHFDMSHMKEATQSFKTYFDKDNGRLEYLKKLIKLGVLYDTPYAGEMMALLADSKFESALMGEGTGKVGKTKAAIKDWMDIATKFYRFGDDFWKIIGFENEKQILMKYRGMTDAEAETEAAKRIRDTYPTYTMVGRAINKLRRFPLVGTFVSFPAEIIRTSYNMLKYAKEDMAHSKELGRRRIAGLAMVSSFAFAAQMLAMSLTGMDDDDEEALRDLSPPWSKNSNIIPLGRDKDGSLIYLDLSFLDPYNYFKRPLNAILRGQPIDETVYEVTRELLTPFFGQDIAFGAISDIWQNKKDSGGRVFNPNDSADNITLDIANHLRKNLQPGIVSNIERMTDAVTGYKSQSGRVNTMSEELAALVGFRASRLNPKVALYYKSYEFQDKLKDASSILNDVARNPNKVSDSKLKSAYERARVTRAEAFQDMHELVNSSKKAGLSTQQIRNLLKLNHVSSKNINYILMGKEPKWTPGKTFLQSSIKKSSELFGEDTTREFVNRRRQVLSE